MGIALNQQHGSKGDFLFAPKSPLLLALLLSIGIHVLIWKIIPDLKPLPLRKGNSQGWLRVTIMDGKTSSAAQPDSSTDQSRPSSATALSSSPSSASATHADSSTLAQSNKPASSQPSNVEAAQKEEPFFMRGGPSSSFFGGKNSQNINPPEAMQRQATKPPDWEARLRYEMMTRRSALYQGIGVFSGQKQAQGTPFSCSLFLSEDFAKGFVSCTPADFTKELKYYLNGARISWQSQKNGLPLEQPIGQPTSQIKAE